MPIYKVWVDEDVDTNNASWYVQGVYLSEEVAYNISDGYEYSYVEEVYVE
ncbi:MAG: hypothetical protein ACRC6V_05015 [Bacteroidales bacterium]